MEFVNRTGCPAGATVTISNLTVAFCMMGEFVHHLCFYAEALKYPVRTL